MEHYIIPNELDEFQVELEKFILDPGDGQTEFYWYYNKGKFKNKYEKVADSLMASEFFNKSESVP